ncbi:MAG: hypothetical protein JWP45_3591 [Mucilaginibacter sp.]|nr:hypothetical protein [Mucilaginibacter sp.]
MKTLFFEFRVDSVELRSLDANMNISTLFNKSEVNAEVFKRLRALNLTCDVQSFSYIVKDFQLYIEGWAYQDITLPSPEIMFSS